LAGWRSSTSAGRPEYLDQDFTQQRLGGVSGQAVPVPSLAVKAVEVGYESATIRHAWGFDLRGEPLSDLNAPFGLPLPSVRGFAVYVTNHRAATPRP